MADKMVPISEKTEQHGRYTFMIPASLEDALSRLDLLKTEITEIEAQLSAPMRKDAETGKKLNHEEYLSWKHRANLAKTARVAELRYIKGWKRREENNLRSVVVSETFVLDGNDPNTFLAAAYRVIQRAREEGFVMDQAEIGLVEMLGEYLIGRTRS